MTLDAWLVVTAEGRWPGHPEACIPVLLYPPPGHPPTLALCPPSSFKSEEMWLSSSSSSRLEKVTGRPVLRPLAKNNGV